MQFRYWPNYPARLTALQWVRLITASEAEAEEPYSRPYDTFPEEYDPLTDYLRHPEEDRCTPS